MACDPPQSGLWELAACVRAFGEMFQAVNSQEIEVSNEGWYGLGIMLVEIAERLVELDQSIDKGVP
jgi:hypothetical protein